MLTASASCDPWLARSQMPVTVDSRKYIMYCFRKEAQLRGVYYGKSDEGTAAKNETGKVFIGGR